jgi:serine/threonine-protein kinase
MVSKSRCRFAVAMTVAAVVFCSSSTFAQVGSGPGFEVPIGIAVEADGSLVVVDSDLEAVVRVDPVSGDRTIISDASTGSGPGFDTPNGIAVEADGSLVVVDFGLEAVVRVDPVSGDRTIISDASIGSGPGFSEPLGLAVEADGSLLVVDAALEAVVRVDPITGDRTVLTPCLFCDGFESGDFSAWTTVVGGGA